MEVRPGYKQTEVGVLPEKWDVKPLAEVLKVVGGGTPRTEVPEYWNGSIPWVSAGDVSGAGGRYVGHTERQITERGLASCPSQIMPRGTVIIIARGATVGRMVQLGANMAFNQTCYCLTPAKELDQDYLYYAMRYSISAMKAITYGTIFGTITTHSFDDWIIPLPTLSEQHAIVAALSDVDALIAALDNLIAKKRDLKTAAMQELLTGKRRLREFPGTSEYHQTEVGTVPSDWRVEALAGLITIVGGGTPQTDVPEYWNGPIHWVSAGDVSNAKGRYVTRTENRITELGLAACPARVLPRGTVIIIARGATVGRMAQLGSDMAFNQTCYGLRAGKGLDQDYLYYAMRYSIGEMKTLTYGTIFGTITTQSFREWMIRLPSLPEQLAIAAVLSDMDAEITALEARRAKTVLLKQGMMQELLTGRIRLV